MKLSPSSLPAPRDVARRFLRMVARRVYRIAKTEAERVILRELGSAGGAAASADSAIARVEWRDQGPTENLLAQARLLSANTVAWGRIPASGWLVFIGALLEAGDRAGAERILRLFAERHPTDVLARCLPVAQFSRELGIFSADADAVAAAADVLAANREADVFGALVAGKSIAVVGNGPGNLGTGRGGEIDDHDLVIRFNNYPSGFEADYGARTDIWVRGAHPDVQDRFQIEPYSLVLWEMDFFRNILEAPEHADILVRDTQFAPEKIAYIDTETKRSLREASGLLLPTSGAQVLWMLHRSLGSLRDVDVYGFSTIDGTDDFTHFFDELGDMGRRHNVRGEGAFLRALLAEGRPVSPVDDAPTSEIIVFNCAYREYDPASGKTGGPAGVLATQRLGLGDSYQGNELVYKFQQGDKDELRSRLEARLVGLGYKVADILLGAEEVRNDPDIRRALAEGRRVLLVCHELGSAYGAYQLGIPYVIVYHQQGSTLNEMRSIGRVPSEHEIAVANRLEQVICSNAQKMYFPSLGARDTFRATSAAEHEHVPFAGEALYNTVSAVDHDEQLASEALRRTVMRELRLPPKTPDTDVFISVGDFNEDKGLDRVPALLERYAERSGRKVVWVAIGSAGRDSAIYARLRAQRSTWRFQARLVGRRIQHDRLLALLDYADYFVMLHRNSIFDLAILEAMRAGKPLILSPAGGNREFDVADNVLFVTDESIEEACSAITSRDRSEWGRSNRAVFEEHFSLEQFVRRYQAMLDEQFAALREAAG